MSKPRTIVKDIVFKSSKTELCNWLHFIYLIQAKIRIYPYLGKPVNGYIAKSSYRNLSLPKGKSQLVFTKTKGSKNGKPIDFDNIKIIGFPTRMDNKVQQYIFDKTNELGITMPNSYSCWSMVNDLISCLRRYSGNVITLSDGAKFTFSDYGHYIVPGAFDSCPEHTFSERRKTLINSMIANKQNTSSPTVSDEEVYKYCNDVFPIAKA